MENNHGLRMRPTEGLRSFDRQDDLYRQGRQTKGRIVTNAKPGQSYHNYGVACDSCFVGFDPYLEENDQYEYFWSDFGRIAKTHGLIWGGDFKRSKILQFDPHTGRKLETPKIFTFPFPDRPHLEIHYDGLSCEQLLEIYKVGGIKGVYTKLDTILGV